MELTRSYEEVSFADKVGGLVDAGAIEIVAKRGGVACQTIQAVRKHSSTVDADAWPAANQGDRNLTEVKESISFPVSTTFGDMRRSKESMCTGRLFNLVQRQAICEDCRPREVGFA
ncbi:hypothetical protein PTI98_007309 [Pleurotus ostreatus]|nr:hypothetical protein PTI98_007309 [Pleurotus ostreatus]